MSNHYFREKGERAEAIIHNLATKTFLTDWCYPNPKKPDGKELCDLLVVFDDTQRLVQKLMGTSKGVIPGITVAE